MPINKRIISFWRAISIRKGADVDGTIEAIKDGVQIRGAQGWLLILGALIACIGLDVNSASIIIGAMLISPIMSTILGIGIGMATLDMPLLRTSVANFSAATVIGLIAATAYFAITPLGQLTEELSSRTMPTILDVGVAFFGGLAGIIASSRKSKTSAIPGVAIATALMPPLCTAGFGAATANLPVFLGATYLFFINAFFISLATYLIAKFLRFPKCSTTDEGDDRAVKVAIAAFAVVITVPSAFIFYNVINDLRFDQGIKTFVRSEVQNDNRQPIRWEIDRSAEPDCLRVYTVGSGTSPQESEALKTALGDYVANLDLKIVPMNVSAEEFKRATSVASSGIEDRFAFLTGIEESHEKELEALKSEIASLRIEMQPDSVFIREIVGRLPVIESARWDGPFVETTGNTTSRNRKLVVSYRKDSTESDRSGAREALLKLAAERWPDVSIELIELVKGETFETDKEVNSE